MNLKEIEDKVRWFNDIFRDTIYEEKWYIYKVYATEPNYFKIQTYSHCIFEGKTTHERSIKFAREYGWDVDDDSVIIGFNLDDMIRNKHLVTGSDLGLL